MDGFEKFWFGLFKWGLGIGVFWLEGKVMFALGWWP